MSVAEAVAARVQAWRELDQAHRAMPDCEHNQAWQARLEKAQTAYHKAIRAEDRARDAALTAAATETR